MKLKDVARGLRKVPRWLWMSAAVAFVMIPAALIYLTALLLDKAVEGGAGLLAQAREQVAVILPQAADATQLAEQLTLQAREQVGLILPQTAEASQLAKQLTAQGGDLVRGQLDRVAESITLAAADTGAVGLAAASGRHNVALLPARAAGSETHRAVSGEDPEGIEPLPGSMRIAFAQDDEGMQVRYGSTHSYDAALKHYRELLTGQGYNWRVVSASQLGEVHEFRSLGRVLILEAARSEDFVSTLDWRVRWLGTSAERAKG